MSNYKNILNACNMELGGLAKALPKEMGGFMQLHDAALENKSLDVKTKELIALGISIVIKCEPCIASHINSLVELGATREEIVETIGVALFMGGGPATAYGGKALAAFDEFKK